MIVYRSAGCDSSGRPYPRVVGPTDARALALIKPWPRLQDARQLGLIRPIHGLTDA
jgi:hypothetical protein